MTVFYYYLFELESIMRLQEEECRAVLGYEVTKTIGYYIQEAGLFCIVIKRDWSSSMVCLIGLSKSIQ